MAITLQTVGSVIRANAVTIGAQGISDISPLASGGFAVTWRSQDTGTNSSIRGQTFDDFGVKTGQEFVASSPSQPIIFGGRSAGLSGGRFVVTWEETTGSPGATGIKAQIFGAAGGKIGNVITVDDFGPYRNINDVSNLDNGNFVVVWQKYRSNSAGTGFLDADIYGQIYSSSGAKIGEPFRANSEIRNSQSNAKITGLSNGNFVVTWEDLSGQFGDSNQGVVGQIFSAAGAKIGQEFLVNTPSIGREEAATVVAGDDGGFAVSWSRQSSAAGWDVFFQAFSNSGTKIGIEKQLNSQTVAYGSQIIRSTGEGYVFAWREYINSSNAVYKAKIISAQGNDISEHITLKESVGLNYSPILIELSDNNFVTSWGNVDDNYDVFVQRLILSQVVESVTITSNGGGDVAQIDLFENVTYVSTITALGPNTTDSLIYTIVGGTDAILFEINSSTGVLRFKAAPDFESKSDANGDGEYELVVRAAGLNTSDQQAITVKILDVLESSTNSFVGTSKSDGFSVSDAFGWMISGLGGADTLTGGESDDVIIGGKGNDILAGGGGNDEFRVGLGDGIDSFDGGSGVDRIVATAADVLIGISSLSGIEAINSNGFAGVAIVGNAAANVLDFSGVALAGISFIDARGGNDDVTGSAGNDVFELGGGNDVFKGGEGDDVFIARPLNGRDSVDGGSGFDSIVAGADGTRIQLTSFSGIEEISAGGFAGVTINGAVADETLDFSGVALIGIEAINGAGGKDVITGSAGDDRIIGGGGGDTLTGGDGADTFAYALVTESPRGLNADVITDFVSGQDRIDLSGIDAVANAVLAGNQEFTFIGADAFTGLGQLRIGVDANGNTALFGNISGNLTADFQISFLGAPPIQPADIIL